MQKYMKFITALLFAGAFTSCTQNYVQLDPGSYTFESHPYTLPPDGQLFQSPRQISIYNKEVEDRGDSRLGDICALQVDNSITNTYAILPPAKAASKSGKGTKNKKDTKTSKQKASSKSAIASSDPASRPPIIAKYDKYPKFNSPMAVSLWKMMRHSDTFTQSDISNAIDLCIVAYEYLSEEYEDILGHNYTEQKRRDCLVDLDNGKGSEIMNFSNTFSRRLNKIADLSEANMNRLQMMNDKKEQSRQLLNKVLEP